MGHVGKSALKKPSVLLSVGGIFSTTPPYNYCAEYQAVLNKAIVLGYALPSPSQRILQDDLMRAWITSGLLAKADVLYMMTNDVGLNFARINWKDPNSYTLTDSGVVSYMTNYGPYSNPEISTVAALVTGWTPSVGVNFTLNNNSMVHSMLSGYAGSGMFYRGGAGTASSMMYSLDFSRLIANNAGGSPAVAASHNNFSWMNRRTAVGVVQLLYAVEAGGSTVMVVNDTTASVSRAAVPMGLLGDTTSVLGSLNAGVPIDAFFAGAALTDTEFINYDLALKVYVNKIRYSAMLYTPTGASNYTVPAGITQLLVECWGGGGAGRGFPNATATKTGAGGAGGAYAASLINVTPAAVIPIVIGAGGVGNATGAGGAGGDTSWNGGVVLAKGGAGGGTVDGDHSNGGTAAASVGTTKYSGGGGGSQGTVLNASTASGGSGAGSLGNGLNGRDAVTSEAVATRVAYNKLGPGAPGYCLANSVDQAGVAGMIASGGGGARRTTLTKNGGNGGQGCIRVSAVKTY